MIRAQDKPKVGISHVPLINFDTINSLPPQVMNSIMTPSGQIKATAIGKKKFTEIGDLAGFGKGMHPP